jgi:hypothetical protein
MLTIKDALGGQALAYALSRPVTARAVERWMRAYTQAASRPGQAGAKLLEQATRSLYEALTAEGIATDGTTADIGELQASQPQRSEADPWRTTVEREPAAA